MPGPSEPRQCPAIRWRKLSVVFNEALLTRNLDVLVAARQMGMKSRTLHKLNCSVAGSNSISACSFMSICQWLQVNPFDFFYGMNDRDTPTRRDMPRADGLSPT